MLSPWIVAAAVSLVPAAWPEVAGAVPLAAPTQESGDDGTPVDGYDLVRPPSECIGFLPKPDCGRQPVDAGDRGGPLQYLTFGVILAGLAFIFTVVFRKVIQADRTKAAEAYAVERSHDSVVTTAPVDPNTTPPSH